MTRNKVCFVYHNKNSIVSVLFYVHYEKQNIDRMDKQTNTKIRNRET